jgi:hypothetical protein
MRCDYKFHDQEHDFPDEEFRYRDGRWVHEVEPRHTIDGRPVLISTDAMEREERSASKDDGPQ